MSIRLPSIILPLFIVSGIHLSGQDLDPRAYVRIPVHSTNISPGITYSHGGVVTDPTLPVTNIKADVEAFSLGIAHTFNFFGMSSQALVALPYSWAQVSGDVGDQRHSVTRSGFADMRLRFSVLFKGAPAATLAQMRKDTKRKTILGASINIIAPTGQFFEDKLINLGTNRWSYRPELAVSQPIGRRWMVDFYTGIWFFTDNNTFYPGTATRKQDPMGTFQGHLSYNIKPSFWVAINGTYYMGGSSSIEGVAKDDRQANMRVGITAVVPTGKLSGMKFAASTGAVVRIGQDFSTYSIGWFKTIIPGIKKK